MRGDLLSYLVGGSLKAVIFMLWCKCVKVWQGKLMSSKRGNEIIVPAEDRGLRLCKRCGCCICFFCKPLPFGEIGRSNIAEDRDVERDLLARTAFHFPMQWGR